MSRTNKYHICLNENDLLLKGIPFGYSFVSLVSLSSNDVMF